MEKKGTPLVRTPLMSAGSADRTAFTPTLGLGQSVNPGPHEKSTPLPSWYAGFNPGTTPVSGGAFNWVNPNTDSTVIRSFPGADMPGQWVTDSTQPGAAIRSNRGLESLEKEMILEGRPGFLYQVDHIIPLWAGGADTQANMQVLTNPEHALKTKAQSVPYTLMVHGKISPTQALQMALNWKDKDLSDIPDMPEGEYLDLPTAEKISKLWDEQSKAAPKVTFKDFFKSIPAGAKDLDIVGEKYVKDNAFLGTIAGSVNEFAKGLASGLSAGWIPYQTNEDDNLIEKGAGLLGNIAGMVLPIGWMTKGLSVGARGVMMATKAVKGAKQTSEAAKAIGLGANASSQGVNLMVRAPNKVQRALRFQAFNNMTKAIPALVAYGQLTPDAVGNRAGRLFEDLAYGAVSPWGGRVLTGGINKVNKKAGFDPVNLVTQTSAETIGVTAAAAMVSMISGDDVRTALTNGVVMGALHGASVPGVSKALSKKLPGAFSENQGMDAFKKTVEDEVYRSANNTLHTYLPKEFPLAQGDSPVNPTVRSQEQILAIREEAMNKLDKAFVAWDFPVEEYYRERSAIWLATSVLENPGLSPQVLHSKNMANLISLAKQNERLKGQPPYSPPGLYDAVTAIPEQKLTTSMVNPTAIKPASGKYPNGEIRLSGMASNENAYSGNMEDYFAQMAQGKASPQVLLVDRPELTPLWRSMNNVITKGEVDGQIRKPFSHPENAVQAYGITFDDAGKKVLTPIGWLPRNFHIAHESKGGQKTSFNTQTSKTGARRKDGTFGQDLPSDRFWHDPDMNKDVISTAMKTNGVKFMLATVNKERSKFKADGSGEPYMHIVLNDDHWDDALGRLSTGQGMVPQGNRSVQQMITEVNSSLNGKQKASDIQAIRQAIDEPAEEIFDSPFAQPLLEQAPERVAATQSLLINGREALSEQTPQAMKQRLDEYFGMNLDETKAQEVWMNREQVTVKDFFDLLTQNASKSVNALIDSDVRPFLESPLFRLGWQNGKIFPELRVLGGLKNVPEAPVTPEVPTAPDAMQGQSPIAATMDTPKVPSTNPTANRLVQAAADEGVVSPSVSATPLTSSSVGEVIATPLVAAHPVSTKIADSVKSNPAFLIAEEAIPSTPLAAQKVDLLPSIDEVKEMVKPPQAAGMNNLKKPEIDEATTMSLREAAQEFEDRAREAIRELQVPSERSTYVKRVASVIKSMEPAGVVPTKTGTRALTQAERQAIKKDVTSTLAAHAEGVVEEAFDMANEISFRTLGDPASPALKAIIRAETARSLGSPERAKEILEKVMLDEIDIPATVKDKKAFAMKELNEAAGRLNIPRGADGKTWIDKSLEYKPKDFEARSSVPQQEFNVLRVARKTEGKNRVKSIEEGLKSTDEYYRSWATTMDEGLKRMYGTKYRNLDEALEDLGSVFTDVGLYGAAGQFTKTFQKAFTQKGTGKAPAPFSTVDTQGTGRGLSHTEDYLLSRGALKRDTDPNSPTFGEILETDPFDDSTVAGALASRKKQTTDSQVSSDAEPSSLIPSSMFQRSDRPEVGSSISPEDIELGNIRPLSTTQDIDMVKDVNPVHMQLFPNLLAYQTAGKQEGMQQGLLDAKQQLQYLMKAVRQRIEDSSAKTKRTPPSFGLMKGGGRVPGGRAEFFAENTKRTNSFITEILNKVKKDLGRSEG